MPAVRWPTAKTVAGGIDSLFKRSLNIVCGLPLHPHWRAPPSAKIPCARRVLLLDLSKPCRMYATQTVPPAQVGDTVYTGSTQAKLQAQSDLAASLANSVINVAVGVTFQPPSLGSDNLVRTCDAAAGRGRMNKADSATKNSTYEAPSAYCGRCCVTKKRWRASPPLCAPRYDSATMRAASSAGPVQKKAQRRRLTQAM